MEKKIYDFTDLDAWKYGHEFVIDIYKLTKKFPANETYGIISQIRRSASSITSNIAEGFSRYSFKDKMRFYYNSRGSLSESQNHLLIARDVGYLDKTTTDNFLVKIERIKQILNGLIRSTEKQIPQ
jgi:four helix bundle protein